MWLSQKEAMGATPPASIGVCPLCYLCVIRGRHLGRQHSGLRFFLQARANNVVRRYAILYHELAFLLGKGSDGFEGMRLPVGVA